jgi:hypothetical protein
MPGKLTFVDRGGKLDSVTVQGPKVKNRELKDDKVSEDSLEKKIDKKKN